MWGGVINGFAGMKFSVSPRMFGRNRARRVSREIKMKNPRRSL